MGVVGLVVGLLTGIVLYFVNANRGKPEAEKSRATSTVLMTIVGIIAISTTAGIIILVFI